jgi:hypothetical protein
MERNAKQDDETVNWPGPRTTQENNVMDVNMKIDI